MKRQYLSLSDRIYQVWINKYNIIILVLSIKIHIYTVWLLNQSDNLKYLAQSACDSYDNYYSALGSLSEIINSLINMFLATISNEISKLAIEMLLFTIVIIKNLIEFYIDVFLGTYTCLLTAAVSGTVNFAFDSSEDIIKAVNGTVIAASEGIEAALDGLSGIINGAVSTAKKFESWFSSTNYNSTEYEDQIHLSIKALDNISIPSSVLGSIDKLRSKTPDFNDLFNTSNLVGKPFAYLEKEIVQMKGFASISEDDLILPQNSTYLNSTSLNSSGDCSKSLNLDSLIPKLHKNLQTASNIILIILAILALVLTLFLSVQQYLKWKKSYLLYNELLAEKNHGFQFVSVNNILNRYQNGLVYQFDKYLAGKLSVKNKDRLYWLFTFISTSYVSTALLVGVTGLVAVLFEYILFQIFRRGMIDLATSASKIEKKSIKSISSLVKGQLTKSNSYLKERERSINNELFGPVKNVSLSMNDTVSGLQTSVNDTIYTIFGSTPLITPLSTLVYCTIGRKTEKIEDGLTWVVQNLYIPFPQLPTNGSYISQRLRSSVLPDKISSDIESIIEKLENGIKKMLLTELYVSLAILGACILHILVGFTKLALVEYLERPSPKVKISSPMALTEFQKKEYGYPYIDPYKKYESSSSVYSSRY